MRLNYIDNIDCLEGLREIPDNSVDLVVTDPPYFLSMGHAGSKENAFNTNSDQVNSNRTFGDLAIAKPFYRQLFQEFRRVLKPDGAFYFPIMAEELPVRNLICWDKLSGPGSYYTFAHELIIFGTSAAKLRHKGGTNVWRVKAFSSGAAKTDGKKVHPTQKPVELIAKCIEDSTEPGAVVLDTFMGSGTTAVACIRTGRNYIGFELNEKYHDIAMERIAAETPAEVAAAAEEEKPQEVHWSRPGPCPLTPEQFDAIYNDDEDEEDWLA